MNKKELVEEIALRSGQKKYVINDILDDMISVVIEKVSLGEKVSISKFGYFDSRIHKGCIRRNPKTGEHLWVEKKRKPVFKPGSVFRERVEKSYGK